MFRGAKAKLSGGESLAFGVQKTVFCEVKHISFAPPTLPSQVLNKGNALKINGIEKPSCGPVSRLVWTVTPPSIFRELLAC